MNIIPVSVARRSLFLPVLLSAGLVLCAIQAAAKPKRIVSMNLCTDQFLLAFADRDQILSLSPFATDPDSSFFAKKAVGIPRIRDGAESVISLKPDILLATSFDRAGTLALVRKQGIKVVVLNYPQSLPEIAEQMQIAGKAIGQPERGNAASEAFLALLKQTRNTLSPTSKTALYYQRGGYASGKSTLMGQLLDHVGLENIAERFGISFYGNLPLERIVRNPPDIFMIAEFGGEAEDQGHQLLHHPAITEILSRKTIIRLPVSETVCPGPGTSGALKRLLALRDIL